MKSKAPLLLMEQMVMLVVFALAAALCVQAFVRSDASSRRSEARDHAVVLCQNAAEVVRASAGDMAAAAALLDVPYPYGGTDSPLEIHYNADWTLCDNREYAYCLKAQPVDADTAGLGKARVEITATEDNSVVFALDVAWQEEVAPRG